MILTTFVVSEYVNVTLAVLSFAVLGWTENERSVLEFPLEVFTVNHDAEAGICSVHWVLDVTFTILFPASFSNATLS